MVNEKINVLHHLQITPEGNVILRFLSSILEGKGGVVDLICVEEVLADINDGGRRELAGEQQEQSATAPAKEMIKRAREELQTLTPRFSLNPLLASGDPVEEILAQLERKHYDLLSLQAYERGMFKKSVLGPHVNEIVQRTTVPTLVHKGELASCERVLIHIPNERQRCTNLVTYLANLLEAADPAITFLVILSESSEKFEGYTSGEEEYLLKSMENYAREEFGYLDTAEAIMESHGVDTEVRHRIGETSEEILKEAKEGRYDLLAFAPEKPNVLKSLWSGDKALKVMQDVGISVLKFPTVSE